MAGPGDLPKKDPAAAEFDRSTKFDQSLHSHPPLNRRGSINRVVNRRWYLQFQQGFADPSGFSAARRVRN